MIRFHFSDFAMATALRGFLGLQALLVTSILISLFAVRLVYAEGPGDPTDHSQMEHKKPPVEHSREDAQKDSPKHSEMDHEDHSDEHSAEEHKKHSPTERPGMNDESDWNWAAPSQMEHQQHSSAEHTHMDHQMSGMYGSYSMSRESSGTSWQPESSLHQGIDATYGDWMTMTHGFANLVYDHQGGPRGDTKTFSSSMLMIMGQRQLGEGTFGLRAMVSADSLMGKSGYPLLLQTGETADGRTLLVDRQHPHDLFMELAVSYSLRLSEKSSVFAYAGLPGEPALGPPAFMHRFSGEDSPAAPISHHWLDSTHITYGVVTLGYIFDKFKLEGSVFRGREPDQFRYNIETGKLDSSSVRLSYNPTKDWALQVSRGNIKSPEQLEPDVNVVRTTASAMYNRSFGNKNWQTAVAWGRNVPSTGTATNAYLLESAIIVSKTHTFFGRAERASKTELFPPGTPMAGEKFMVGQLSAGYIYDVPVSAHFKLGFGGQVTKYSIPGQLDSTYGSNPASYMVFARLKIQ
jgi:hypothetical protein